jgi:hypothetical protein
VALLHSGDFGHTFFALVPDGIGRLGVAAVLSGAATLNDLAFDLTYSLGRVS